MQLYNSAMLQCESAAVNASTYILLSLYNQRPIRQLTFELINQLTVVIQP